MTGDSSRSSDTTTRAHYPATMDVKEDRLMHWLKAGAQPSESALKVLKTCGAWERWERIQKGEVGRGGLGQPPGCHAGRPAHEARAGGVRQAVEEEGQAGRAAVCRVQADGFGTPRAKA